MLKTMRKNVKALKPTLWIIIATFIAAIFYIWGGAGRLGEAHQANTLVTIGKERISSDAYSQTLRQRLEAMKKEFAQLNRNLIQQLNIPQQVLQQIVEQALILQLAREMKLDVTDREIRDQIVSYPVFQKDGQFIGFNQYKQILEWSHIPLADFEAGLRKEILIEKVIRLLTAAITVSEEDVWEKFKKTNESAALEYVVADQDKIELPAKPDAAAIQAHFEKNKSKYKVPAKRTADCLFFKTEELKKEIKVENAEIEKYYKDNIRQFKEPEKIKVSRIYLPFTDQDKPQILIRAEEIMKRIQAGEDFASLARTFSKDEKAKDGGDWGVSGWTALPAKETEEIRKLDPGRASGIIEGDGGAAILKVTEKTPEITKALEDVKTAVKNILEDQKARERGGEKAARIEKIARKQKSLDIAAQKEGYKVTGSGPLKEGDPLGNFDPSGTISRTLFTLKEKEISMPLFAYGGVAVIQLRTIEPERPATLEDIRDEIEKDVQNLRKREKALEKLNQFRAEVREHWDEAAQKYGLEFKTVEAHKREQYLSLIAENAEVDRQVFSLPLNQTSRPLEFERGYVLLRVLKRKEAVRADFEKSRDTERTALLETEKNKFLQSVLTKARDEKKVKVNYELFLKLSSDVTNRFSGED